MHGIDCLFGIEKCGIGLKRDFALGALICRKSLEKLKNTYSLVEEKK